jgi:hypothetical protein
MRGWHRGFGKSAKLRKESSKNLQKSCKKGLSALPEVFQNSGTKPQAGPHATKKG